MNTKYSAFFSLIMAMTLMQNLHAQDAAHDSVDVLHYDLTLDMGHHVANQLTAEAVITFTVTRPCNRVTFDLIADSVQPVTLDGTLIRGFNFDRDNRLLAIYLSGQPGDTHTVKIPYTSRGYVESYGFGGLHLDADLYYNLGAAFREMPHCFGRSFYPCRDNFYDKATYTYRVTSQPGWCSMCSGLKVSSATHPDGSLTEVWQLSQPSPTYISSVSSAPWRVIETTYQGNDTLYPATLGYLERIHDSSRVHRHFAMLDKVLPAFEYCFGPYRWQRIGYIATPIGSMEHAQNIALVSQCMDDISSLQCEMTTCHELGHAWFGNLVTCATAADMWINEGGASFCEEVANEAIHGHSSAIDYYQRNLSKVVLGTHHTDNGYRALHGMSEDYTYGSTTYDKGALVWHSLRGYLGDSLFYPAMRRLFDHCAFTAIDSRTLCDSLSLYSGTDLTPFFDFHVDSPGFVDYELTRFSPAYNSATVTLSQRLLGTNRYARGNRISLAFFSRTGQRADRLMTFDDSVATASFSLPFSPMFVVVDPDCSISSAATLASAPLTTTGGKSLSRAFCRISVPEATALPYAHAYITHHFTAPTGAMPQGTVRTAHRYWQVSGIIPWDADIKGQFLYNQGTFSGLDAAYIDEGFYEQRATVDSLCLLYRPDAQSPWRAVSHTRTASSGVSNGYLVGRLLEGQYTLAVADTNILAIPRTIHPADIDFRLFPNPAGREITVQWNDDNIFFDLDIHDISGRSTLKKRHLHNHQTLTHNLPAGTYIAIFQNKFLSLQSQIVVQ